MPPFLSVITPFAGGSALPHFLASLRVQSLPPERFEVILVADGGHDVDLDLSCPTRVIHWERPHDFRGHSAGILRNVGAAAARGDVLVFLDADVVLHPDCLAHHARHHEHSACLAVGGAAHELPVHNQPSCFLPFDEILPATVPDYRPDVQDEPPWARWFSLNASVSRPAFESAGRFSERGFRCQDFDLAYRLFKLGTPLLYAPEAEVVHFEHPRSLRVRADQVHGWMEMGRQHPEIQAYVEDRIRLALRSFRDIAAEADTRFDELTAGLPGHRLDCSWICPPGTDREDIDRRLAYCPHNVLDLPGGKRLQLRLHKKCWDYSIDLLAAETVREPVVTVVCPIFNGRGTLPRAVASVVTQDLLAWELILVDDASSDGSARLASDYLSDPRVRFVSHRRNRGLSHALNTGLALARSPLLVQLDCDDVLEPHALARILDLFSGDEATLALYGDPWVQAASGEIWTRVGHQLHRPEDYFEYREYQAPRAYRTGALKEIGGWLTNDGYEGRMYDDRLVLARLADVGKVAWISEKLYRVHERPESLSRRRDARFSGAKYAISWDQANRRGYRFRRVRSRSLLRGIFDARPSGPPLRSWSVIVPFSRSPEHLLLSLRSWLESDLLSGDGELLVVGPGSMKPPLDPRVRFVDSEGVVSPGRARNRGARLARGEMLFFSDEDHVVPQDVVICHERAHAVMGRSGAVIGNVFGRRGAVAIAPEDRPEHKRRILEGLRWSDPFPDIASRVATGAPAPLPEGAGTWQRVGQATFTETWMRRWGELLVHFGEDLGSYPHRWTRLSAGSLSIPAALFWDVGGFREDMEALEDWELGARLQCRDIPLACAPDAEPYHLIHPVDADRRGRDLRSYALLAQAHPELLAAVMSDAGEHASPARGTFHRYEEWIVEAPAPPNPPPPSRACSLTFDDGPHPLGTPVMLDVLRAHGAKATFFCLGHAAEKYPDIVRAVAADGHEVGIHGWTHTQVDTMTHRELKRDIQRSRERCEQLVGRTVRYARPPYGTVTAGFLEVCRELGLEGVGWHTTAEDWVALRPEDILFNLAWQGVAGKIVLLHDGCGDPDVTGRALGSLLAACSRWDCPVVPLSEFAHLPRLRPLPIERWADVFAG